MERSRHQVLPNICSSQLCGTIATFPQLISFSRSGERRLPKWCLPRFQKPQLCAENERLHRSCREQLPRPLFMLHRRRFVFFVEPIRHMRLAASWHLQQSHISCAATCRHGPGGATVSIRVLRPAAWQSAGHAAAATVPAARNSLRPSSSSSATTFDCTITSSCLKRRSEQRQTLTCRWEQLRSAVSCTASIKECNATAMLPKQSHDAFERLSRLDQSMTSS